jgi:hypothetical protein
VTSPSTGKLETAQLRLSPELTLYETIRVPIGAGELESDDAELSRIHEAFMASLILRRRFAPFVPCRCGWRSDSILGSSTAGTLKQGVE